MSVLVKDEYTDLLSAAVGAIQLEHQQEYIEWMPHEWVPWDLGRNFALLGGQDFTPDEAKMDATIVAASTILLLHKDQLPSYHRILTQKAPWGTPIFAWINRWTAEDAVHAVPLRDFLVVTRSTDPAELEMRRLNSVMTGYMQRNDALELSSIESIILVALTEAISSELAAKISEKTDDIALKQITAFISRDDAVHAKTFKKLIKVALEADFSAVSATVQRLAAAACPIGEDWGEGYPEVDVIAKQIYLPEDHQRVISDFLSSLKLV